MKGKFTKCEQGVHDANTGNDAMVSVVSFVILDGDTAHPGSVVVRQTSGGSHADHHPYEVGELTYPRSSPQFKYEGFRDAVERYYRQWIGEAGRFVGFGENAISMEGLIVDVEMPFEVEPVETRGGW